MYKENPKTAGSGIMCVIPQKERCPLNCKECFFQSGRSYLEPLEENLPNIPEPDEFKVFRINDGNDSSIEIERVLEVAKRYKMKFYNTSLITKLDRFDAPVVLTVNPGEMTDKEFYKIENEKLMYVRFRCNSWNFSKLGKEAIMWYAERGVPIVLTFMAYHDIESVPEAHRSNYEKRKRTMNDYWCIKIGVWKRIMKACKESVYKRLVWSCGGDEHECRYCGNCLRLYFKKMAEVSC